MIKDIPDGVAAVGNPCRVIREITVWFFIALNAGECFQQFYTIVDTIIVGRGVGMRALAAIGAADWLNWLFLWMVAGMRKGIVMAFAASVLSSVLMFIWRKDVLSLFISAEEVQAEQVLQIAHHYLMVMSTFLIILYALHTYRSALQGMGDTVTKHEICIKSNVCY